MNRTYYNHIDLVNDLKSVKSGDIFNCDFDIYFLDEYFYNNERGFNWYKEKLRQVRYQQVRYREGEYTIITSDRFLNERKVYLTNFGFIPRVTESRGGLYFCFTMTLLMSVLLNFQKQEINEHIKRVNRKYEELFDEILEYERRKATEETRDLRRL